MQSQHRYYAPYSSDNESDEESSMTSESELSDDIVDTMIGSPLSLVKAGAPKLYNTNVGEQAILRMQPKRGLQYYPFDLSGAYDGTLPNTGTTFDMNTGIATTILIINSRDRDRNVYPQPTFFTLRVPRTYRNIVSFQILQLKLLSAFFYFRPDKENTAIQILEYGRTIQNERGETVENKITNFIRTGSYDIVSLLNEIQIQLNKTPLFFDFPNGITDFVPLFTSTGDLGTGFNQPGDTYYDSLRRKFVNSPTMATIVSYYFSSQYAGLSTYTLQQVKYAYYYPVLYECYLDPEYGPTTLNLNLTSSSLLPGETIDQRILYTAQGLNDPVIAELINNNLVYIYKTTNTNILDYYRLRHTFRYSLVNGYACTYETFNNRINISASTLNTSLVNLINLQAAKFLAAELQRLGLTQTQYNNLLTSVNINTAVLTNMYNFLQSNMANYFAVNFNTYAPSFFADVSNSLFIQNGLNATGVDTGYSISVLSKGNQLITSSTSNLQDSKVYWPNMKNLTGGTINYPYNLSDASSIPYSVTTRSFLPNSFVDASGLIYTDLVQKAGDIIIPVEPAKYTVFRFRSAVRQNLQVETMPLPYYYRYVEYNKTQGGNQAAFFDVSYQFLYNSRNNKMDNTSSINLLTASYGDTYASSFTAATTYNLDIQNSVYYFRFVTPLPTGTTLDASGYKYDMNFTVATSDGSSAFPTSISFFLYHDRGTFMADVSGLRQEIPYHYNAKATATVDASSATIPFTVYAQQTYYMIFRTDSLSFPSTTFKAVPWYPTNPNVQKIYFDLSGFNPFGNPLTDLSNQIFANVNDLDFVRLPSTSNLWGLDPSSSVFNQNLPISEPAIGYDVSGAGTYQFGGVSTDLTDYKGFLQVTDLSNVPFSQYRKDPLTNYSFNSISPYNTLTQTYFYGGSSNAILKPYTNSNYSPGTVVTRQFKTVHWYDYNYIPKQLLDANPGTNVANMQRFTRNLADLSGYDYEGGTSNIVIGNNIVGFTFLPNDGVWRAESMFFKSAWNSVTDCSNDSIQYIGIYPTNQLTNKNLKTIQLSNALQVMEFDRKVFYDSAEITANNGFDARGGTYYKFILNSNFPLANSNNQLIGYTVGSNQLLPESALYSMIAFNSYEKVTSMYLLAGSLLPHPEITDVSATNFYFESPSPNGKSMIIPRLRVGFNPAYMPADSNYYVSQYEQSFAIGTQALHYSQDGNITNDLSGLYQFTLNPYSGQPSWFVNTVAISPKRIYAKLYTNGQPPANGGTSNLGGFALYNTDTGTNRTLSISYSRLLGFSDIASNISVFRPTSLYCTGFNSNLWNFGYGSSNFTIYKDDGSNFFLPGNTCVSFTMNPLVPPQYYYPLNYCINNTNKYGIIFNGINGIDTFYSPIMAYFSYSATGSSTGADIQNAILKGSNGYYHAPISCNSGKPFGDFGCGLTMDVSSNTVFCLPYDQYFSQFGSDNLAVTSGSNLYQFEITAPPNPDTSTVGFTKGTIVYQFTGSPATFSYVNYYKDGIVFLRTLSNDAIYYINSSNFVSSNENYSFYTCTTSRIAQNFSLPLGYMPNFITGPGGSIMFGPNQYDFTGSTDTPPRYIAYLGSDIDPSGNNYFETYVPDGLGSYTIIVGPPLFYYVYPGANGSYTLYKNPQGYAVIANGFSGGSPPYTTDYYTFPAMTNITNYTVYAYIPNDPPFYDGFSLLGNRGTFDDEIATKQLKNAWQIFYPNFKLNLTKLANSASPITNTTDLTDYPYYPHTSMFFYDSFNKMVSDISGLWAHEKKSNFIATDVSSGYFFFSYINTINLKRSSNYTATDNNSYNYLAIRGYSPTERFKCLLRFYLPGRYDFGYISLFDIMQEAQQTVLVDLSGSSLVNPSYAQVLNLYNNSFKITSNFGNNSVPGFGGSNLTFTGFSNFMTQYGTIYQSGLSNANLLNSITSNVLSNLRAWISQYLGNILPSYVLQRDNFTAALTFSILWNSQLTPERRALDDDWGLGYNLGFAKIDTPYSTVQRATSFFKILDDFIYLRLNPEFTMNRMDTCSREDLAVSHDPTGATNQYAAKLLLASFGSYATVLIQNPINFNPVLTSLDRLSFEWVDTSSTQIDNNECEWNAVVQIQEQVTSPRVGSTIPQPPKTK